MPPRARRRPPPPPEGVPPEYLAAAGGILGAQAAGTEPEPPDSTTRAALVAAILVAIGRYHARARVRRREAVEARIRRISQDEVEVASAIEREEALEVVYAERQKARIREELSVIAALADPRERARRVQGLMRRERSIDRSRTRASAARAGSAVERVELRKLSPSGAYWRLREGLEHCAICLFMANRFWPWEVLEETYPPVHTQCGCSLHGLGEAIASGWLSPGDVPERLDALALARGVVLDEVAYEEAWLDLNPEVFVLLEAFGSFHGWDPALHPRDNLGRFANTISMLDAKGAGKNWAVQLDSRSRVSRDPDGTYRLTSNNRIFRGFKDPADVAVVAVNRSAKMGFEGTVGGPVKRKDFDDYLKTNYAIDPDADAWVADGGADGAGGVLSKGQLDAEAARIQQEISNASAFGDKYVKRIVPELKKRRDSLARKAKVASTVGPGPVPDPADAPVGSLDYDAIVDELKKMGVGDVVKYRGVEDEEPWTVRKTGDFEYEAVNAGGEFHAFSTSGMGEFLEATGVRSDSANQPTPPSIPAAKSAAIKKAIEDAPPVSALVFENPETGTKVVVVKDADGKLSYNDSEGTKQSVVGAQGAMLKLVLGGYTKNVESGPDAPLPGKDALAAEAGQLPLGGVFRFETEGDLTDFVVWRKAQDEFSVKAFKSGGGGLLEGASSTPVSFAGIGQFLVDAKATGKKTPVDKKTGLPVGEKPAAPPTPPKPDDVWGALPTGPALEAKLDAIMQAGETSWSFEERQAITAYTSSSYEPINKQLRAARELGSESVEKKIVGIDGAFEKSPALDEDVVLWRGVGGKTAAAYGNAKVGDIIRDNGYGSTSTREDFASSWGAGVGLKIRYPKGRKALWAKPVSSHSSESEVMLPRGVAFRVVDVRPYAGGTLLVAELASGGK